MLSTNDGGHTWHVDAVSLPAELATVNEIRFADPQNGWITARVKSSTGRTFAGLQAWVTHNGGATWAKVVLPGPMDLNGIEDLETSTGVVVVTYFTPTFQVDVATSPVGGGSWSVTTTSMRGPNGGSQAEVPITLQPRSGWIESKNDRGTYGGARLFRGAWVPWTPPCRGVNPVASPPPLVSAQGSDYLIAYCGPGFVTQTQMHATVQVSTNGGATFVTTGRFTTSLGADVLAAVRPGVAVMGTQQHLLRSVDTGEHWTTVLTTTQASQGAGWKYLAFTTSEQGVGITSLGVVFMTYNGGLNWTQVQMPHSSDPRPTT